MPKPGFRSITIKKSYYDMFESTYNELKEMDKLPPGIQSFAGYVTYKMLNHIQEKESLFKLASKINIVPAKFTDNKITIKVL